jgi:hypothetical protein
MCSNTSVVISPIVLTNLYGTLCWDLGISEGKLCHAQGKKVFLALIRLAPTQDRKTQVHNVPGKPTSGPKPDRLDLGYISGLHVVILHLMSLPHHNSYCCTSHVCQPSSRRVQYIAPTIKRPETLVHYRW